jgi:hypothetical protein
MLANLGNGLGNNRRLVKQQGDTLSINNATGRSIKYDSQGNIWTTYPNQPDMGTLSNGTIDFQFSRRSTKNASISSLLIGQGNTLVSSGVFNCLLGQFNNVEANGSYNFVQGLANSVYTSNVSYAVVFGTSAQAFLSSQFALGGTAYPLNGQACIAILNAITTDATPTLLLNFGIQRFVVQPRRVLGMHWRIVSKSNAADGYKVAYWEASLLATRDNSGNTRLVGTPVITQIAADAEAVTGNWSIGFSVDDSTDSIDVTFTGEAATTISTMAVAHYSDIMGST